MEFLRGDGPRRGRPRYGGRSAYSGRWALHLRVWEAAVAGSPVTEYELWHMLPRAYWLPPNGHGNGLDATGWAPLADVPDALSDQLLDVLRAAGVAGYVAATGGCRARIGQRRVVRVWADAMRYATAEDVVRKVLSSRGLR